MNLITLLVSEDEGSHRHVINVLSNPVHLGHHPVHSIQIFSYDMVLFKEVLPKCVFFIIPAMTTIVQAVGTSIPYVCGIKLRPLPDSSFSNVMITFG